MTMIKDGEVRAESTPCDICGLPSTIIVDGMARCPDHMNIKSASVIDTIQTAVDCEDSI